jgi:prepilin-type N-terminal cleavage/methylation domain-containing protein
MRRLLRKSKPIFSFRGFTLVELIMVMILIVILAGISINIYTTGVDAWNIVDTRKDILQNARLAIVRLKRAISESTEITETFPLVDATSINLWVDIDDDTVLEKVEYFYISNSLRRRVDNQPAEGEIIAEGVSLFKINGGPRVIEIDLSFQKGGKAINFKIKSFPRKVKDWAGQT